MTRHDRLANLAARFCAAPLVADKSRAASRLADLFGRAGDGGKRWPRLADAASRDLLAAIADHSPFLWGLVMADPARLARLLAEAPEASLGRLAAAAGKGWMSESDAPALMRRLRLLRTELALLVALADCGGVWGLEEVTRALTAFADACVGSAVRHLLREAARFGRVLPHQSDDPAEESGVVVLALGKHGAGELNYSSDIDLVVFFDPQARVGAGVEPATFFARLTQGLVKLLQERTPDGYVFRVDLRLRPDPGSTAVAVSLPAAFSYYETVGQNWERAAFIKARPVAGDLLLGRRFLADLTPFVWRKYFDFATIADIHAMKRQIHVARGFETIAVAGHDIKLGRGGIREIEFFVQTQQLVFGGRRPALRVARTLDTLDALLADGWITQGARDDLRAAYVFLRTIEHRLQMIADLQTQRLPDDTEELRRFARFGGFGSLKAFASALTGHARAVQRHYALLFEEGRALAGEAGNLVFTGTTDDPETIETLARLGFRHPATVAETVRGWHFGRRTAVTSARAREALTELVPALLAALARTGDPDSALAALDQAFGRMPAAVELLSVLRSNERLLALFADILGSAPRLAEIVSERPHVLDVVIDPAFAEPAAEVGRLTARLRSLIGEPASHEEFLDRARDAARQEAFLAGARMLSGVMTPERAGKALAAVAETIVAASFEAVARAFAVDHGAVPGGRAVVVALGRLGAREMTASSDLDLVVLYDFDPNHSTSAGPHGLHAAVYYTRLTQRLLSALTVPTRRGRLYEVDLRLRPEGRKGPLATQFTGFVGYQAEQAETWEHMALTRARVIAGDPGLARQVEAAIGAVLALPRDIARLGREIRAMRALLAKEKGDTDPWDVKLAAGGLVDIEFAAQFFVLAHARAHPEIADPSTSRVLEAAVRLGLMPAAAGGRLADAFAFLSAALQWQRLTVEGRFDPAKLAPAVPRRIASALGLPDAKALERELSEARAAVRAIVARLIG